MEITNHTHKIPSVVCTKSHKAEEGNRFVRSFVERGK